MARNIEITKFTGKEWNNSYSFSLGMFIGYFIYSCLLGLGISIVLLIFIPNMRSVAAVMLVTGMFALMVSIFFQRLEARRAETFLSGCSDRINLAIEELSGDPAQNITPRELEQLITSGTKREILLDGVPGLCLSVSEERGPNIPANTGEGSEQTRTDSKRMRAMDKCWRVSIGMNEPQYGTESFDRLLQIATTRGDQ